MCLEKLDLSIHVLQTLNKTTWMERAFINDPPVLITTNYFNIQQHGEAWKG